MGTLMISYSISLSIEQRELVDELSTGAAQVRSCSGMIQMHAYTFTTLV